MKKVESASTGNPEYRMGDVGKRWDDMSVLMLKHGRSGSWGVEEVEREYQSNRQMDWSGSTARRDAWQGDGMGKGSEGQR